MLVRQTKLLVVLVAVVLKMASKADSFSDVLVAFEHACIRQPILAFLLALVWFLSRVDSPFVSIRLLLVVFGRRYVVLESPLRIWLTEWI